MNRLLLILAVASGSLLSSAASAQGPPPAKRTTHVHISEGPVLESATDDSAIIRWTSNNPGGSDEHFGVVHYGTDSKNLSETAKSHSDFLNPCRSAPRRSARHCPRGCCSST